MRTTLTLEDDVAALLKRTQKRKNLRFRDLINQALREGLLQLNRDAPRSAFKTAGLDSGPCLLGNLDNVGDVVSIVEGETWK